MAIVVDQGSRSVVTHSLSSRTGRLTVVRVAERELRSAWSSVTGCGQEETTEQPEQTLGYCTLMVSMLTGKMTCIIAMPGTDYWHCMLRNVQLDRRGC